MTDQLSVRELLSTNPDLACSGGAIGSDTAWGDAALAAGHNVLHFGFEGHHSAAAGLHVRLTAAQLARAHPAVRDAHHVLQERLYPMASGYNNNLLRRNWYQIRKSRRLYATAPLARNRRTVDGGTGWAVQMWLDHHPAPARRGECWVFDTVTGRWYAWSYTEFAPCEPPPCPHGVYAAVGTRYPTPAALAAIEDLYNGSHHVSPQ